MRDIYKNLLGHKDKQDSIDLAINTGGQLELSIGGNDHTVISKKQTIHLIKFLVEYVAFHDDDSCAEISDSKTS